MNLEWVLKKWSGKVVTQKMWTFKREIKYQRIKFNDSSESKVGISFKPTIGGLGASFEELGLDGEGHKIGGH